MWYIGTSGYSYKWWWEYPNVVFATSKIPTTKQLQYYASKFHFIESCIHFYKIPSKKAVQKWYTDTPADFTFSVKFTKKATHTKKFIGFEEIFKEFWEPISELKEKCIAILIQLPPSFKNTSKKSKLDNKTNMERVVGIQRWKSTKTIPNTVGFFVEFRDESWYNSEELHVFFCHWILDSYVHI